MSSLAKISVATLFLVAMLQTPPVAAEASAGKPLELAQILGPKAVTLERPGAIRWLPGGAAYSKLEKAANSAAGMDVVRYDVASGTRSIAAAASELSPPGSATPLAFTDHEWSPDGRMLLLKTDRADARRNNPVGDCWVFDVRSRVLRQIGRDLSASGLLHPEFSPDGSRVAYVANNNLYVEAISGGAPIRLTSDRNDLILNGRGDLAYEEEFSLGKAYLWSPDSRRIAYWQFDTNGVGTFYMIRNTGGQYSTPVPLRYPKPGTTNSAVRVGVVSVDKPATRWFALAGDPRDNYVPRMTWLGATELLIQHENRRQNTNRVLLGDAETGTVRPLMVEKDDAWLLPSDHVHLLPRARRFTWMSERDGWMHLYTVSADKGDFSLRTPGDFDVISVESIDVKSGYAYFIASPVNVAQRILYRATLTGPPKVERLTPSAQAGSHDYNLSPTAQWAIHTFSSFDQPPVVDIVRLPQHEPRRTLVENALMRALLAGTSRSQSEFFKVDIGGSMLDAWMMKPPGFDASKKYPLLVYVYSEPAGQTVVDRWGGDRHLWHLLMTQHGFLVASVDSRGAATPRGHDWRRSIYRQIGIQASADQAAAIRRMLAERPYIDKARIGVWGWSGGGAMTLNAMFRYPELYAAGVAVASPTDQMLYNSIYQERYMGLPAENVDGYRDGSPINFAQNLTGALLIIHGTGDDNVHYQNAEQLVDRLIGLNMPFSMMAYPDRTHGIGEGANTRLHLFGLVSRFLEEHLALPRE